MSTATIKQGALEVLKRARQLLDAPNAWTKRTAARDTNENPVGTLDSRACKFCMVGAISRAAHEVASGTPRGGAMSGILYHYAVDALKGTQASVVVLPEWNDAWGRKHIDVLCAFDLAILQQEGLA